MKSNDMINLIIDVEKNQHGITQLYPSRIHYFQRTKRYDSHTFEVTYDEAFEQMIIDFEKAIGGTIYKEGIVITGFRTEILHGFGIILSFIFACDGFFFRR